MSREQLDLILHSIKRDIEELKCETDKIVFVSEPLYEWLQFCLIIQQTENPKIFGTEIGIVYSNEIYFSVCAKRKMETGWKL